MRFFNYNVLRNLVELVVEERLVDLEVGSWGRKIYIKNSAANRQNIVGYKIDKLRKEFDEIYNGLEEQVKNQKKLNGSS